jgi:cysteine-rich repeat protein
MATGKTRPPFLTLSKKLCSINSHFSCYFGHRANNLEYGIGSISLTYNGREQVEFDDLAGFNKVFKFGNCVADAPSPSPTQATASPNGSVCGNGIVEDGEECDDGNLDNTDSCLNICELARCGDGAIQEGVEECDGGDGCSSTCTVETVEASDSTSCSPGESLLELRLLTDRWARSENYLYFYDDATPDDERIWSAEPYALEGNSQYDGSHCLDPSRCYLFFFFDSWGDGFLAGGRLTLTLDGTDEVLDVIPGDTGTDVGDSGTTTFWSQEFGPCTSVSSNNDRSYSVPTSLP